MGREVELQKAVARIERICRGTMLDASEEVDPEMQNDRVMLLERVADLQASHPDWRMPQMIRRARRDCIYRVLQSVECFEAGVKAMKVG